MRRLALVLAALLLAGGPGVAQPVPQTPPADDALVAKIAAWVDDYGSDLPEIVRAYGRACFTDAVGASPAEIQVFLAEAPDLDLAFRQLDDTFAPQVYGRIAPRISNCGGVVALATMIADQVADDFPAASAEAREARIICMSDAVYGLPIDAKESIFGGNSFSQGLTFLARDNLSISQDLEAQLAQCPTPG